MFRIGFGEPLKQGGAPDWTGRAIKTKMFYGLDSERTNNKEVLRIGFIEPFKQGGVPDWTQRALKTRRGSGSNLGSLENFLFYPSPNLTVSNP